MLRKKLLIVLIYSLLMVVILPSFALAEDFNDISTHWARDYITQLHSLGYVNGYGDGTYKPDFPMTKAEFTTLLINAMNLTPSDSSSSMFSDTSGHWATGYINTAVQKDILIPSEYPSGLKPDTSIKRSEVCAMLMRALSEPPVSGSTNFTDQDTINQSMYKGYIKGAIDLGLISGYTDGSFNPFGNMKRGEICRVVSVFLTKYGSGSSSIGTTTGSSNIYSISVGDNTYDINSAALSFKSNLKEIPIITLASMGNVLQVNGQYNFALNSNVDNPDIIINNIRYAVSRMQVFQDKLIVATLGQKINVFTYDDYKYTSDYVKLYVNSADSGCYLEDMIIDDESNVTIKGESYNLLDDKISIVLGNDFYDIVEINFSGSEVTLDLDETERLVATKLNMGDFADIYVNDRDLDLDDVSTLDFIIDGDRKRLKEITLNGAGQVLLGTTVYKSSQVTVIIDDSYYQLERVIMNNSGKFILYCSDSDVDEWVRVNGKYYDEKDIQIVYDDIAYDMAKVYVVDHNKIRINGKQRSLDGSFKLKLDGLLYDIEDADEGDDFYIADFETDENSYSGAAPARYSFYNEETLYYDDDLDSVEIEVNNKWITFDKITVTSPSYFSYNGKTYELLDARILIDDVEFEVDDTAWHGKSERLDIIMKPV